MVRWSTRQTVVGSLEGCEVVTVLVGDEQREFTVHRKLLCDSCAFFQSYVDAIPSPAASSKSRKSGGNGQDEHDNNDNDDDNGDDDDDDSVLWLPNEAPDMFELFVLWLYQRKRFHTFLDHALLALTADDRRAMRTNLVRLHLFAAVIDLAALQDAAMDALQDLYLRFDWDMSPAFLAFLYGDCEAAHAVRLRKWAVAMLAWTLHGAPDGGRKEAAAQVDRLFAAYPELKADYGMHLHKMAESRADVRVKNPQLRLPANELRSGERYFGFRQCTFHSHRATVGEGTCPHALALGLHLEVPPRRPLRRRRRREKELEMMEMETLEEMESDVSEDADAEEAPIISPVGNLNEISYLDLS
ncbi:uncharacterized protein B0T15DRAFT_44138 [Chaetomium strumarium]|uniref:BTB domain-containing protein n=1 Tax=Chaetomium strumarium TaxID=1170767 RepID=A0AAJ0H2H0_9PEZI|nr:hypothetical protein B0T15DRAFT_44138 [Chaetomium strumarium]